MKEEIIDILKQSIKDSTSIEDRQIAVDSYVRFMQVILEQRRLAAEEAYQERRFKIDEAAIAGKL